MINNVDEQSVPPIWRREKLHIRRPPAGAADIHIDICPHNNNIDIDFILIL